jgi:ribonuclease HII
MAKPVNRRKNTTSTGGHRRRLPDVPGVSYERRWWASDARVAGLDEVGRGAWAGPVTFAAVVLPSHRRMYKLRDSKMLDPERRSELAERLDGFAEAIGVGHASNAEIDRVGMSQAMRLAARRAVDGLCLSPEACLLDGNWDFLPGYPAPRERIVHGDAYSASIAAASIIAKVTRDRFMAEAGPDHPAYRFERNKGYPSPEHKSALAERGPTPMHRHSWGPVRAAAQPPMV